MADQAKLRKRLDDMLKRPENQTCIDCKSRGPRWASANLGIFFCLNCSGIHRKLGVHISFVRSVNLDSWTVQQVENMERWGNKRGAAYFEAEVPASYKVPREGASVRDMERWIRDKYEFKRFVPRDGSIPSEQEETKTETASSTSDEVEDRPRRQRSPRKVSSRSSPKIALSKPAQPQTPVAPTPQPEPEQDLLDFSEPEFVPTPTATAPHAAGATSTVSYSQFGFFSETVTTTVSATGGAVSAPGMSVTHCQTMPSGAEFVAPQHAPTPSVTAGEVAQAGDSKPKVTNEMIMSMFNPAPMQMSPHMNPQSAHMAGMSNGMGMGYGASSGMGMPGASSMPAAAPAPTVSMGLPMGMNMGGMGMGMGMGMGVGMAPNGAMQMGGYPAGSQMMGGGFGGASMGMGMGMAPASSMMSSQAAAPQYPQMGMMGMPAGAQAPQMQMPLQMMNGHSAYGTQYNGWTNAGMTAPSQPQRLA